MAFYQEKTISPEWSRVSFYFQALVLFVCMALHVRPASAQVGASLSGVITD